MTRINCIPPKELHDRHLVAEYHELPRVFHLVKNAAAKNKVPKYYEDKFPKYTFGEGHVKFFYSKLRYLAERHIELIAEMINRKMRPQYENFNSIILGLPKTWYGQWEPSKRDLKLNRAHLAERMKDLKTKKRKVITPYNEHELPEDFNGKE